VEGYARPEGMLRPGARLSEPELWVCLRGGLAVGWEGREDAASAGPGGVLSVPAGGEARVVSTRPDTVALRVTAT
jgi:hypothetical protein